MSVHALFRPDLDLIRQVLFEFIPTRMGRRSIELLLAISVIQDFAANSLGNRRVFQINAGLPVLGAGV